MLEYQNKQMAIEFGFKERNRMCQLHINRGVVLELGQTEVGSWATERAKLGCGKPYAEGLLEVVKIQCPQSCWGCTKGQGPCPVLRTQRQSGLNAVCKPLRVQVKRRTHA